EGTTSSIAFVHDVLFPYARTRLADFVRAHRDAVAPILDQIRAEAGAIDLDDEACIARLLAWHDEDRKIAPLKTLQGMIWADGYAQGAFTGHVHVDAVAALRRWHAQGIALYVYSSGSVDAQKLLFGHSDFGDLAPLFSGFFDTATGGKRDAGSYAAIARAIGLDPAAILFLSDVPEELAAARLAGLSVILVARDGAADGAGFPVAASFDTILPAAQLEAGAA
ncbi:MAG: enolase-phosphatase, partial [Rhizorhabdus sp.]|nr:enolase-phosphatase [Rhizorhabdus sp.]